MKTLPITGLWLLVVAIMALLTGAHVAEAVTCSPLQLSSCAGAISSSTRPSASCCSKLREQRPCLCGYLKNPNLRPYVQSPGAKTVASACGVAFPSC
ncbi:non-specific lipid-transfer protein 2-like [Momordica charantia]|uniref:Non-specific lipid-transfer protein 2-like n=1 Tax=Momordica charantia TaxID=3673 RepID=A0A6J1CQB8_MOMCH|nr:non-specific lipid-transfer protein 2-like [Momordica charantia]